MEVVTKHNGIVFNGHDHCLGHFFFNDTNFILSGAAGYPQAGDCNNGTAQGPYALYLAANNLTGKSLNFSSQIPMPNGPHFSVTLF